MPDALKQDVQALQRMIAPTPAVPVSAAANADDYDADYLAPRLAGISANADLPLAVPMEKKAAIVSSAELLARCKSYLSESDVERVKAAFRYADDAHLGQFRKSGEPYITHPLYVASLLADWHLDATTICAGLMHDVLEDTGVAKMEMAERFGMEVTEIVDGVSKLDKLRFSSNEIAQAESFRKMLFAMSRDVRVILVKLADRLHNLRTLGVMRPEKKRRIARETLEIYVPIAHRLGLNRVYRELQELSFMNHYPLRYEVLRANVMLTRSNRRAVLERILRETRAALPKAGIIAQVQGRDKTIYGIYNQMKSTKKSFSEVLDIYGFRVIVRTREECYLTLCALHQLYKPVNLRFKDFIAIPKSNGYQSLHTTVVGPYGTPIEYQIRTQKMHRIDELGILTHWMYGDGSDTDELKRMVTSWLQSLMEIQRTSTDSSEFIENIKIDLFPDRVYVFTPKSKIISLPQGSCAVDFAYQIHTDVGSRTVGCKINGEAAELSTQLKNGDMVEIITGPGARPDPAWLNFVRSGKARAEVRQYLRSRSFEESAEAGKQLLEKAALALKLDIWAVPERIWKEVLKDTATENRRALCADIGLGKHFADAVAARIHTLVREQQPHEQETLVSIRGTEGVAVQLATCCHPVPGDQIWGFMRKGHGLSVHRADCEHVQRGRKADPQRWMQVGWKEDAGAEARFPVPIEVDVEDERKALAAIAAELAKDGSSITGFSVAESGGRTAGQRLKLTVQVRDRVHLIHIVRQLRNLDGVRNVARRLDGERLLKLAKEV